MERVGVRDDVAAIRPMRPDDVPAAADAIRRGGWGEREAFFAFAATHPECRPIVAEANGEIVGTGVATVSGSVGWVGTIWVSPERRGRGLGRALTEQVIGELEDAHCRTLILVATDAGRPVYEKLGFTPLTHDHAFVATGLPPGAPDPGIRPFEPAHLESVAELDSRATGEDRRHLIAVSNGWVIRPAGGKVRAFALRSPFGGISVIAANAADAMRLFDRRRREVGPEGRVRAGPLEANEAGRRLLIEQGWLEVWSGVRMIRGAALEWEPSLIWSQYNHAVG